MADNQNQNDPLAPPKQQDEFQSKIDELVNGPGVSSNAPTNFAAPPDQPLLAQPAPAPEPKKSFFQKAGDAAVGTVKFLGQGVIDYANDLGTIYGSNVQSKAENSSNEQEIKAITDAHSALIRGDISHGEYTSKIQHLSGIPQLSPGIDLPTNEQVIGDSIMAGLTVGTFGSGAIESAMTGTAEKALTQEGLQITKQAVQERLPFIAQELIEKPWLARLVSGGIYGSGWGAGAAMSERKGLADTLKQAAITAPFGALADLTVGPLLRGLGNFGGKVVDKAGAVASEELPRLAGKVVESTFGTKVLQPVGDFLSKVGSKFTQADTWNLFSSVVTKLSDENMYGKYGQEIVQGFKNASLRAQSAMGHAVAAMEDAGFFQANEEDLWRNKGTSLLDRLQGGSPDQLALPTGEQGLSTELGMAGTKPGAPELPGEAVPKNGVDKMFETADNMRREIMQMAESRIPNFSGRENYYPHLIPQADVLGNANSKITQDIVDNLTIRHGFSQDGADQFVKSYSDFVNNGGRKGFGDDVLKWIVENGQADSVDEARGKLLRQIAGTNQDIKAPTYGPLEKPRDIDLPLYDPNPARSMLTYGTGALKRLGIIAEFGADDAKLNELVGKIQDSIGGDSGEDAARLIKNLTGQINRSYGEARVATSKFLRVMQVLRISTAGILHANQSVNNLLEADFGPWVKGLMVGATDDGIRNSLLSGATVEQTIQNHLLDQGMGRNFTDRYMGMIGLNKVMFFNRTVSANTGMLQADHLLQKVLKNPSDMISQLALGDLIGENRVAEVLKNGALDDTDRFMAGNVMTDMTQRNYNPGAHPAFWNSPEGKVITQFKGWAFDQAKFVKDSMMTKLQRGDTPGLMRSLLALGVVMPATSEVLLDLKSLITGGSRPTYALDRYIDDFVHMGGIGILYDTIKSASYGKSLEAIAGPTVATVGNLADSTFQNSKHHLRNLVRNILDVFGVGGHLIEKASGIAPKPKVDPNNKPMWEQIFGAVSIPTAQAKGMEGGQPVDNSGVGVDPTNPNIISNVDMTHYAANPKHPELVRQIYNGIPEITHAGDIETYIKSKPNFKKSPITGAMVLTAANKYGVDPKLLMAEMQQDSGFGTQGAAARNRNPGNVATYGKNSYRYPNWQAGVTGAARALARFRTVDNEGVDYADAKKYEPAPDKQIARK